MDWLAILWSGFVASTLAAAFYWAIRSLGWTRFSPSVQLGCVFVPDPYRPLTETIGFVILFLLGSTVAPSVYAAIFAQWTGTSWLAGLGVGAVFGLLTVAALPLLGTISACVRAGVFPPPGPLGFAWGRMTPVAVLAGHLIYGGITGAILAGF